MMSKKRKLIYFILIILILSVVGVSLIFIYLRFPSTNPSVNNTPISLPIDSEVTSFPSSLTKEQISNYVLGGPSFYCPNHPSICQKIQNYYSNISRKNFTAAYEYGKALRSYEELVNTYKEYLRVSASYVKENSNNSYTAYVTIITNAKEILLYSVQIEANENGIVSSIPTPLENKLKPDCNYIDLSNNEVCVFKFVSNNEIANLIANSFFYKPQFFKGEDITVTETIYYYHGQDALDEQAIIYKYNNESMILTFIDIINYKRFPDIEGICTNDRVLDNNSGGCAEKYLQREHIEINNKFLNVVRTYNLPF